ncbi:YkgJ family cysteine cluster protein [uncultured Thiothrix sp.]|uniref:YkgJ family cysteine cluster protein n=1 Tax=uncultured Thiothrix sp. TaxID=223185 RepID=UPI002606C36E|nr:YkgJ family cysteine cluster protein [uncultured Thiothrix sp.]
MDCRLGCAACCIAPSISSPTPKHPKGKASGVACLHLSTELRCELFGDAARPQVCSSLMPTSEMCGENQKQALAHLFWLEQVTSS